VPGTYVRWVSLKPLLTWLPRVIWPTSLPLSPKCALPHEGWFGVLSKTPPGPQVAQVQRCTRRRARDGAMLFLASCAIHAEGGVAAVPPLRRLAALPLLAFAAFEFCLSASPLLLAPACRPACCRVRPLPSLSLFRSSPVAGPVVLSVCLVPVCWSSSSGLPPDTARPRPDGSRWERRLRVEAGAKAGAG